MVLMKDKTKSTVESKKKIMAPLLLLTPGPQTESFSQLSSTLDAQNL